MHDPFFTLTQLRYLLEVDKYKSFHQAANACNVSQPTLSMQIQKVEDYYDTKIFLRTKRSVKTTQRGKELLKYAKKVVLEAEQLHSLLLDSNLDMSGTYQIGIIPTTAPYLLPLFIENFKKTYPNANIIIQEMQTDEILEALKDDKIDFGILATPLNAEGIKEFPIYYEEFLFYLPAKSPLLKQKELKTKDLPMDQLLLLEDGHCFKDQALEICSSNQNTPKALNLKTGSIQTLTHLCDRQGYATFLPELSLEYLSTKQKKQVKKLAPNIYREISIVCPSHYIRENLIDNIKKEIRKSLPSKIHTKKPRKIIPVP